VALPGRCVAVRVLGPVEIAVDGRPVALDGAARAMIVVLALADGHPVPLGGLVGALWGDPAPPAADARIAVLAANLCRALVAAGASPGVIGAGPDGYRLSSAEEPDLWAFDRLVTQARARTSAGWLDAAADAYRAALRLWRGAALGGVTAAFVQIEAARLEELRLTVLEERIEVDLKLCRHADLVAELTDLTARHPLRERLLGQLMLALYRCDRTPDALAAYRSAERFWHRELGLEPGVRLQQMCRAVAAGHPSLQPPRRDAVPRTERPQTARPDRVRADERSPKIAEQ
jgi:DNA-binding SARP family transcriptional activator